MLKNWLSSNNFIMVFMRPFIYILTIMPLLSFSQGQGNNWCFGDSVGLHFNSGTVNLFSTAISTSEIASTISDSAGNLLFYSGAGSIFANYTTIWDNNDIVLANGTSLYGSQTITQGNLLLPIPERTDYYYLFHIGLDNSNLPPLKLFYSIVDDSSLTKQIIQKNTLVIDSITEKFQAIRHANGRDWWLVCHKITSNTFYTFLVSPDGIFGPFSQNIGTTLSFSSGMFGQLVFSCNGNKICLAGLSGVLDVFDFDRCTGLLSNYIPLGNTPFQFYNLFYGASFSNNEQFLYASTLDSLVQFNLNAPNILASCTKLFEINIPGYDIGQHAAGPDGKIYIANAHHTSYSLTDSFTTHLTVIENPNLPGNACGCAPYSFSLGGRKCRYGLPNIPNYNLGPVSGSICDSLSVNTNEVLQQQEKILISPNPAKDQILLRLNFGILYEGKILITDVEGRKCLQREIRREQKPVRLDVSSLQQGFYFLRIFRDNQFSETEKFVIIR